MCIVLAKEINSLKKYINFGSASATQFITMSCSIELLWSLKTRMSIHYRDNIPGNEF